MQEKMSSRNPFVRAIASATSHVWFPLSLFLAKRLPRPLLRAVLRQTVSRYMQARPKYTRALSANLAVILGREPSSPEVRRTVKTLLDAHFTAWLDFLHFATRPPEEAARLVESVVGYSRITDGRDRGNGVLLLTAHLGNWEVGGLMLAEMREPIHVVLVPDIFPAVERSRRALHARAGIHEIRVDRSHAPTLAVLRALKDNGIVAMQGDRDFSNTGIAVPFFGRDAYFPRGPFLVAMATAATVLPAFIVRVPDGRYRAIVEEPLPIDRGRDREVALKTNVERYVAILERYVAAHPEQWYCFYPFWEDPSRGLRADTAATKNAS
ncbi:MAG TPA: lysophospholipid acyltransferase family protein [Thermoanaerobaculia bacterium]|nr:lysophospholipid acyltransferase family protein [Thermoanaerobaculia bacterium]